MTEMSPHTALDRLLTITRFTVGQGFVGAENIRKVRLWGKMAHIQG